VLTNFHVLHKLLGQSTTLKVRNWRSPMRFASSAASIEFVGETGATEHLRPGGRAIAPDGAGQTEGLIDAAVLRIEPPDGLNLPAPITVGQQRSCRGRGSSLCVIGFPGNPELDIAPAPSTGTR
jgi:hypothetical protein